MPAGAALPAIWFTTGWMVSAAAPGMTAVIASVIVRGSASRPMIDSMASSAGNSASTP